MNRRRNSSLAGSPLLIGAVTVLIAIVAVYLSYNALNGLPFVPTYDIKAEIPNGASLVKNNDIRIGGSRVGVVQSIAPVQNQKTGRITAIVSMKLNKSIEPLPANTIVEVQSASTIGLKYLELIKGTSSKTIKNGETIPITQAREPVLIDQFFGMFDEKTRHAAQHDLVTFGNGFVGRGLGLNEAIHELRSLVNNGVPVLRNLASPSTDLHGFWVGLDRAAKGTAPVAQQNADMWSDLDTFFKAWASVAPSLEQAIEGGPPALEQATHSLRYEASFTEKTTEFMHLLHPAASALRTSAQAFGDALEAGVTDFRTATELNERLKTSLQALRAFSEDPVVALGLNDLTETAQIGTPVLSGLASEQSTCGYVTSTFRNVVSLLSQDIGIGTLARATIVLAPNGPNNEGFPSSGIANGPSVDKNGVGVPVDNNHVHYNPYPNVAGLGQPKSCEAANEKFEAGKAVTGHVSGPPSTVHDELKRSENVYGRTYPAATLKDLAVTANGTRVSAVKTKTKGAKK
jgi:ABC-type transporter Mla subunit MlaD